MSKKRPRPTRKTAATKPARPKVSQTQATEVFRRNAESLRKQGAHAMSLKADARGPLLEVYVPEDFTGTLPSKVQSTVKGKKCDLRIKAKKAPRFQPEKL